MEEERQLSEIESRELEQELLVEADISDDFAFYSAFLKD
jgi:hypothetical protein